MTPEQIRIAVAESLGWKSITQWTDKVWVGCFDGSPFTPLPHFTTSLDACTEFEKTLTPQEEVDYVERLAGLIMNDAYEEKPYYHDSLLSSLGLYSFLHP